MFVFVILVKQAGAQIVTSYNLKDTVILKGLYILDGKYNSPIVKLNGSIAMRMDERIRYPKFYSIEPDTKIICGDSICNYLANCDELTLLSVCCDTNIFNIAIKSCSEFEANFSKSYSFDYKNKWYKVYKVEMVCLMVKMPKKNTYLLSNPFIVEKNKQDEFVLFFPYRIRSMSKVTKRNFKKFNKHLKIVQ